MSAEDDELSPAEQRLVALLAVLTSEPLRASPALTRSVLARARWELRVRRAARALDAFTRTLGAGLAVVVGRRAGANP